MSAIAELTYLYESLTYAELRDLIFATSDDFEPIDDTFLEAYALKLSKKC